MFILFFADSVKLQIDAMLAGLFRRFAKLNIFGETDAVGGGEYPVETDLAGVCDCFEVIRRKRRFATREENDYLSLRFE